VTAWVWVFCAAHPPYSAECDNRWRYEVPSTAEALTIARAEHPHAPTLAAQFIIDCEHGQCVTRLHIDAATTLEEARRQAAGRAGWFTVRSGRGGRKVRDHCQFHTGPALPASMLPGRSAPSTAGPPGPSLLSPSQLSLFGEQP
jgi:hypothetical protein